MRLALVLALAATAARASGLRTRGLAADSGAVPPPPVFRATFEEHQRLERARASCRDAAASSAPQSGVVVYLATRHKDLVSLRDFVLPSLARHYLRHWPYPVIVFVPSPRLRRLDPDSFAKSPTAEEFRAVLPKAVSDLGANASVDIEEFDLEFPKVIDWKPGWTSPSTWPTAYLHMNQFFTKTLYEHRAMRPYKYYMRMDTDLQVVEDVEDDPFCLAREMGRKFFWQKRIREGSPMAEGMAEWFEDFATRNGLTPRDPAMWGNGHTADPASSIIYKGFVGLGDLSFFRSPAVRKLARAFNEDGRIYEKRWSDQSYYVQLLALLQPHEAVGDVGLDLPVCHKCFSWRRKKP